jgi:hypothetical protein
MEELIFSESLVNTYKSTGYHNAENPQLRVRYYENIISKIILFFVYPLVLSTALAT